MFTGRPNGAVRLVVLLAAAPACSPVPSTAPAPTEIRVLSSNGVRAVIEDLRSDIERAIGRTLAIEFSTAASLKRRIEDGEAFDVAILTPALIDDLIAQGSVAADSRTEVARTGVGVGVRDGAPPADISTPDALRRTLLEARSVAFTAEGQSRPTIDRAFVQLGIADAMRPKLVLKGPGEAPAAVAAGEAEMVLTLMSEILPVPGLRLLGPLPDAVQGYVVFAAGRSSNARDAGGADALLRHLSGPAAAAAMAAHGLEAAAVAAGSR
jgi:molybdate transport system substrate-binding protein